MPLSKVIKPQRKRTRDDERNKEELQKQLENNKLAISNAYQ